MDLSAIRHSNTSVKDVLELLVKRTAEVLGARGAILRVLNLDTRRLELGASYGLNQEYLSKGPVSSQKIITDLCRHNKVIIIDDVLYGSAHSISSGSMERGNPDGAGYGLPEMDQKILCA